MIKICIVAGARPNFIKVAPLIRAIIKMSSDNHHIAYNLVYAGTKNDNTIEDSLFNDLQIPRPDVYLGVDSESLNELTGKMMWEFERYLDTNPTDVVIVVDDLASTMAAAIVAKKRGIRLAHLVAGTRSFDINMPKEINRLVIDSLSDMLFTAGISSNSKVSRTGTDSTNIYMVGNILMDTLRFNHSRLSRPAIADSINLEDGKYIVLTINRKALLNNKENLYKMIHAISTASSTVPVVAPLRDTACMALSDILPQYPNIIPIQPLSYLEFGYLTAHARGIITDSGNVAEEATFNNVPCITLNSYTEHIETVNQGTNVLVGENPELLGLYVNDIVHGNWKKSTLPDRWDGRTADRILKIILNDLG